MKDENMRKQFEAGYTLAVENVKAVANGMQILTEHLRTYKELIHED